MKKFKEIKRKKRMLFISGISVLLLIIIVLLYRSYAIYQESQDFNVIHGSVPEYLSDYDVKLSLTIDGTMETEFPTRDSGKVFESAECDKGAEGVWDYEHWAPLVLNTTKTRTKCKYHFVSKYSDSILNGADPVLKDGLIPVTIDDNGVVRKANESSEWYNYKDKVWANAVILEDETKVYQNGEIIPEGNIESYFVWIPRYKYKIFNEGNYEGLTSVEKKEQIIQVEFENKSKSVSTGNKVGEWLTHPAFTSFDVNGMWVGKFETGYKGATSTKEAQVNAGYASKIQIKPNVYSWRAINSANAFLASYEYQREMDSHMMKNTEWGAVAYLQHSVYGSGTSLRINNNSSFITGYAAKNEPTCGYTGINEECNKYESTAIGVDGQYMVNYKNSASVVASTTGNYSGIYDMSGGASEYVMGVMMDQNGNPFSGRDNIRNSGFVGLLGYPTSGTDTNKTSWTIEDGGIPFPDNKYYDQYAYAEDDAHYNRRILGDATGEMGPFTSVNNGFIDRAISSWYQDEVWFVWHAIPWFSRGGDYTRGVWSGIFNFILGYGTAFENSTYRVVLTL